MAPSSASTVSTVTQGPAALPLFKFSYCTSPNPQAKMIWTHLPQGSDMFAVFDAIRKVGTGNVASEMKVLKVVRGGELLELVEFQTLQDQVRIDEQRALSQTTADTLLHVLIIVKRPLLALRYTLPDGQIRKMQMNFVPYSGCDIALETFRAAGLPIRDKDLPQGQSQRPQSSQSQHYPQERPGSFNADEAARPWPSQGMFPDSDQSLSQRVSIGRKTSSGSILLSTQPTNAHIRPTSAPDDVKHDGQSRPISASSLSTLNAFGSPITITSVPTIAKPRAEPHLLPSPIFNVSYEPSSRFDIRPVSAPEQTLTEHGYANTTLRPQLLPPERILAFPEKTKYPFATDEAASQDQPVYGKATSTKTKAKRQTKPRAQPAKARKSRAKAAATITFSDSLAPSSPSPASRVQEKAPVTFSGVAFPELHAALPISAPLALPNTDSRKHPLTDQSTDQPSKRQAQPRAETGTESLTDAPTNGVAEQPPQALPSEAMDPLINITNHALLDSIDDLMRKYHDVPAPRSSSRASKDYLAEYAAQSEDDRVRALDNLICKCIEDESFVKLMEDVEGAWKRIGLGL